MNKTIKSNRFGRLAICATTGALVALPLLAASAQAAPPDHAPAYGYYKDKNGNRGRGNGHGRGRDHDRNGDWRDRNRDDDWRDRNRNDNRNGDWRDRNRNGDWRDRDRNGDWRDNGNNGYNNGYDGNPVGDRGTMVATVIRDLGGGRFEVRADDNRTFTVRSSANQTRRMRSGDRVELVGYLTDQNVFVADTVNIVGSGYNGGYNGGSYNNSNIDFYATVLSASSSNRLTVRADDGQTFYVTTRNNYSSSVNRGDRVRVVGYSTNRNVVSSASVTLVSNNGGGNYGGSYGQTVDFNGTVVNSNSRGGVVQVRGDNGRTYTVRPNNDSTFNRGERVRVVGTYNNGTIYATSINRF